VFTITEVGERVLAGTDDIELNGIDMWLGGVHLTKERMWRWDVARNAVIPNQSQGS
jgi:hypothetical protein